MVIEFILPELGENVESGDVVNVLVGEGDQIVGNQGVVELETDKAVVEIPCPHAGQVTKIHVKKGDTVKVGEPLLTVSGDDDADSDAVAESDAPPAEEPAPEAPPEKPKAKKAPASQVAPEPAAPKPAPVPPAPRSVETPPQPAHPSRPADEHPIPAGPAARRIARELGVDLAQVQGSGAHGRITPEDVRAAVEAPPLASAETTGANIGSITPPGEPSQDKWGPVRIERLSKIRRTIADQMSLSANTIPHVTNFDDADVTELEQLRKGIPKGFVGPDLKLTAMPFVMKAVAVALRRHPTVNASLDMENGQVLYREYVHLGVAVDTPRGLVVPKIRDVDRLTIPQIARALVSLAERARAAQFTVEELRGGSFSISNLGAVGGTYSTPIINFPEVAILLLGRTRSAAAVRDGQVVPRMMMPLSLSYDHRLVDGANAGRFLNDVIDLLQSPGKLLLSE